MSATDLSFEFESQNISDVGSDIGATLTLFNEKLYAGWKGSAGDARLWYSSFDGRAWDPQQLMPEAFMTSHGPSLATFHNAMYAACNGGTQWGVDGHNDALEDEAKRGKEDITELIAEEQEKGANPQYI
jgi:hypothetical protein